MQLSDTIATLRRYLQAIVDGRIEAQEALTMTDEQLAEYDAKLAVDTEAAVAEEEELSRETPE